MHRPAPFSRATLRRQVFATFFLLCFGTDRLSAEVAIAALPPIYTSYEALRLTADSQEVPIVANGPIYQHSQFSFSGRTLVTITAREPIASHRISPLAFEIPAEVHGNTLRFVLEKPSYLIVKINDLPELVLAADALETDVPPAAGPTIFNICAAPFAADPSGRVLATAAVQGAIDAAHVAGGGTVYVPPGVFVCGNLVLKSHVDLYLAAGAVIRGTGNPADYTTHYHKKSLRMDGTWFIVTAPGARDIRLYGRGTIDGRGSFMRNTHRYLNHLLVPLACSDFTVEGITFKDSGLWQVIPTRSRRVTLRDTKHFNENDRDHENDAIDIQECQQVLVSHAIAVAEDDTYSTKTWDRDTDTGVNWPGEPQPLDDVVFEHCVGWSRCATFKLGFGNRQPQTNVTFRNSYSYRSMRAIAINHRWGAAPAENIVVDSIDVEGFWPRDGNESRWLEITARDTGPLRNVTVRNCNVRAFGSTPSLIRGASESGVVQGVTFSGNTVNGVTADTPEALNIAAPNEFVRELVFTPAAP